METKHQCPTEVSSRVGLKIWNFGIEDFSFHYQFFYFSPLFLFIPTGRKVPGRAGFRHFWIHDHNTI